MRHEEEVVRTKSFIFSQRETKLILNALDYVYHRQVCHNKAEFMSPQQVEVLRKDIRQNL